MKSENSKVVTVYDFETQMHTTIPASELGSGMIRALVDDQECWINPLQSGASAMKGPFFHAPFDKSFRGKFRRLHGVFKEVYPITLKEWEDGFRRDLHPLPQIESWLFRASVFEEMVNRHELDLAQKKELLGVVLQCATCPYEHIGQVVSVEKLPEEIMEETIQHFYGEPDLKKLAALKPAVEYPDPSGNTPRPAELLLKPEEREHLKEVDIVYGVDSHTGQTSIFWGKKVLQEIIDNNEGRTLKTISYLYDSRTNQLEMIDAAVSIVKGSSDYQSRD